MPRPSSDLPDPLNDSQQLPLGNVEDLLSRLADQEIDRMIGPNGTRYDLQRVVVEPEHSLAAPVTPVQQVTAQLDHFFKELKTRDLAPPAPQSVFICAPASPSADGTEDSPPVTRLSPDRASRAALIAPIEEPTPMLLRPLAWLGRPVSSMSPGGRAIFSAFSILAFAGSLSAFAYVWMLRQG